MNPPHRFDGRIRAFAPDDAEAAARIYGHYILNGTATFEETPPSPAAMLERFTALTEAGFPVLVACGEDDQVLGYAYAGPYNARSAYRFTVENSIYLDHEHQHKGIGRALLLALITACRDKGYQQIMAVIGDSNNEGSIHLHRSCGFAPIGTAQKLGFKFNQWLDVVYMQFTL